MSEDLGALGPSLEGYIRERSPAGAEVRVSGLRRMAEGWSRESFAFTLETTVGTEQSSEALILRRDPVASLIDTDRQAEFRVIAALHAAGMAVPRPFWLERDGGRLGAPFMVMEMLPGTAVPEVLYAPGFAAERRELGRQFFTFLGTLHAMDVATLGLADVLPAPIDSATATRTEIGRWDAVVAAKKPEPQPVLREVSHWLRRNLPGGRRPSLLHGDYRSGNFLFEGNRLTGVVDWEMASVGNPLQDLGWVFMDLWRLNGEVCGFFSDEEALKIYAEASGIPVAREELDYWVVLAYYKLSAIAMQSIRTALDGRNREIQFATSHLWVPGFLDVMARAVGF